MKNEVYSLPRFLSQTFVCVQAWAILSSANVWAVSLAPEVPEVNENLRASLGRIAELQRKFNSQQLSAVSTQPCATAVPPAVVAKATQAPPPPVPAVLAQVPAQVPVSTAAALESPEDLWVTPRMNTAEDASQYRKDGPIYYESLHGQAQGFSFQTAGIASREWNYSYPGRARRDIALQIADVTEGAEFSSTGRTSLYFFPRKNLPAIVNDGKVLHVTLPTGETVDYDAQTKKLMTGGILKENPPVRVSSFYLPPKVSYQGSGVVLKATETGSASTPESAANTVTISKKGSPDCQVAGSEVFDRSGPWPSFKFATDEAFNTFIKAQCGFTAQ